MIRISPVTRILTLPTLARLGLLLVLVVAVFLAESFTSLMERALRFGGGGSDIFVLLMYQAPGIVDLALALGVLIALFFALLEARDRGELVILATSGVRWTRVLGFALWFGVLGGVLSVFVSGLVVPAARYAERLAMTELRASHMMREIVSPGPRNTRQTIKDTTFIATPPENPSQIRGQLFGFRIHPDGSWRAAQSQDWDVIGDGREGSYEIRLNTTVAYESPGLWDAGDDPPFVSTIRVNNMGAKFEMDEVLPAAKKTYRDNEHPVKFVGGLDPRVGEVLAKALLVPMAALLAVVAVLLSGRGIFRFMALPAAVVLVFLFDVLGRTILRDFIGVISPVPLAAGAIVVYLGPSLAFAMIRGEALMLPVRGKA